MRLAAASAAIALALCATARAGALEPVREASALRERFEAAGVPAQPLAQAMRAASTRRAGVEGPRVAAAREGVGRVQPAFSVPAAALP